MLKTNKFVNERGKDAYFEGKSSVQLAIETDILKDTWKRW